MSSKFEDFRYARWFQSINQTLQVILCVLLIVMLNILGANYAKRFDLTKKSRLSAETVAYLHSISSLPQPNTVKIIAVMAPSQADKSSLNIYDDVYQLLREYEHASYHDGKKWVDVEWIDIFRDRKRAEEFLTEYDIQSENTFIVTAGKRSKQIAITDLYEIEHGKKKAFVGEQTFTSALLSVTSPSPKKIYFLTGHGEMRMEDTDPLRGLSEMSAFLSHRNIKGEILDLSTVQEVPTDSTTIICPSPQTNYLPSEIEKLRRYLTERNGHLLVFLNPHSCGALEELFFQWGVLLDNRQMIDLDERALTPGGDFIIRNFSSHPITNFLRNHHLTVLSGMIRPVRPDLESSFDERLTVLPLFFSSETSWASPDGKETSFNPQVDLAGPLPLATVSERCAGSELGIRIAGGRLVVFGSADFIANNRFHALGNKILLLSTLNGSLDRHPLLYIPPRPLDEIPLALSRHQLLALGLKMLAFLPGGVFLIGMIVLFIRKK